MEMRINSSCAEGTEAATLRRVLEIVGPGDAILIKQVKNRPRDRLVSAGGRERVGGGQVAEGGSRHQIGAVGKSRPKNRGKVAIIERKFSRQIVVERKIILAIEPDRLIFSRVFRTMDLL